MSTGRALVIALAAMTASCRTPSTSDGADPGRVFQYLVVMQDRAVGVMSTTLRAHSAHTFFTYQDRGRGPHLRLRAGFDAAGLPVTLAMEGEDEDNNAVAERFERGESGATWRSDIDSGSSQETGAFYVPVSAVPETLAHLVRALLRAEGQRLPLLPSGEARLQTVREETLVAGGGSRTITLYAVDGLQFGPSLVWLEEDGSFFASGGPYLAVVRREYVDALPTLFRHQQEALAQREQTLHDFQRSPGPVAVRGARVVDVRAGTAHEGWTVVAEDGWIVDAGPDASVRIPVEARIIEAQGQTLLPGLWDLHTHPEPLGELLHLGSGVIGIRDLGSEPREALARRNASRRRVGLGPRLFIAGLIDGPGTLAAPTQTIVRTAEQARAAVDRYAGAGFDGVKVYNSLAPALVPVIAARARERGLPLSGHIPRGMTAEQAVRAGLRELHHAYFLFPSLLDDQLKDHPEPQHLVMREAPWLELHGPRVERMVQLLLRHDVAVDATLALGESLYQGRRGAPSGAMATVLDRLPPQVRRRVLASGVENVPPETSRRMRSYHQAMMRLVARLHARGVRILAGSDGMAGFTLLRELELLQEAGIPAPEVLRLATLGAAEHLGRAQEWGTVERGRRADLLLVAGDPLKDVSVLRRASLLLFDGAVLSPSALYEAASVRPLDVPAPVVGDAPSLPSR